MLGCAALLAARGPAGALAEAACILSTLHPGVVASYQSARPWRTLSEGQMQRVSCL